MVLAIGIVVDDAIVVVEAVHAKMESSNIGAHRATSQAMEEISGAIIAITLVMSSVFLPTAFMGGPAGVFYKQFSLTMAISIFLSGIVALTLTPALCTIVLKKHQPNNNQPKALNTFFILFNKRYQNIENKYLKLLLKIVNRRMVTFTVLVLFTVSAGILGKLLPNGFIPNEDQGTFYASVTTPPGATLERTKSVINEIQKNTYGIDAIESVSTLSGTNILSDGTGATYGTALINLKPWAKRSQSVDDVIEALESRTRYIKDAKIEYFPPPAVPGYGNASGYELRLLDKTGSSNVKQMEDVVKLFIENLKKRKEIASAFTIFDASFPQYTLHIDNDKAAQKGITVNNAMSSLQTLLGSEYATNFIRFGQMYKVMVQALPQYRAFPDDILKLYVRNENNEMIPMSAFMSIEKTYGVDQTTRYNMFPSAEINGEGKASISSGTVLKAIQETAKQTLPNGYDIDWAGISRDEVNAGSEGLIIFAICLVFVYLVLAAQYESFLLPISVLLSLPIGVFGAFFMLWLLGLENKIYAQIDMIMLIGLLGKNAILIIEFATLKHREGKTAIEAAIEGAKARLRPILMTSFAFVAGLLPLMFASGAGAVGNKTIGTAAAGGMVFGTIFGVIIVPGLYVVFATLAEKFKGKRKEQKALTETL
jgi:HAE1 family hydrophobic/amphiphilic exporter-1